MNFLTEYGLGCDLGEVVVGRTDDPEMNKIRGVGFNCKLQHWQKSRVLMTGICLFLNLTYCSFFAAGEIRFHESYGVLELLKLSPSKRDFIENRDSTRPFVFSS